LASIWENISCSAPDRLLDAEVVDPVDDWLCAAISAFMVAGDICAAPVNPVVAVELAEAEAPGSWNGFSPDPLEGLEDEFDEVSELMAFSADDAAPRANNIGRNSDNCRDRRPFTALGSANAVPC
jgi:hypothetical protein